MLEILKDEPDLFVVDVTLKGNVGNQRLLIELDGDDGISIDRCGKVSRQLGSYLEEKDLIPGKFILEVSSPGADKPLMDPRQYKKHIGRELSVEKKEGEIVKGMLRAVDKDTISIEHSDTALTLAFEDIEKTNVLISFK